MLRNFLIGFLVFLMASTFSVNKAGAFTCSDGYQVITVERTILNPDETVNRIEQEQTCQKIEDENTKGYLNAGVYLIKESVRLTAPIYLLLLGMGIFRRYILARI